MVSSPSVRPYLQEAAEGIHLGTLTPREQRDPPWPHRGLRIPTVPPFLVVEILSPEDRLVRLQPKIQDYLSHGVAWVWVIDPDERRAMSYSLADPGGTLVGELRTQEPEITISLAHLLAALDS